MKHGQAADRADGAPRALLRARRPEFPGYVYLSLVGNSAQWARTVI
jgi:hypothetical protein